MRRIILAITPLVLIVVLTGIGVSIEWAVAILVACAIVQVAGMIWLEGRSP